MGGLKPITVQEPMSAIKYLPYALLVLGQQGASAQQLPTGGSQLLNIPATHMPQHRAPRIEVQPNAAPAPATTGGARVLVRALRVTGAQAFSEQTLLAATGFKPDSDLTLAQLRAMAALIADLYQRNGYFVAQAYLPAQDIQQGILTIAVIEGRYGKVALRNKSRVSDAQAGSLLGGLQSGDLITNAPLESRLLLLSDLPGVNVQSTLAPSATPGASDLLVELTPGQRVSGSIDADNAGNRYTGAYRLGATVNVNEPMGYGDVASLRVMTAGTGLNYARASYQLQLGKARLGVAYSHLDYELGREFKSLGAHGNAKIASLYGSYPLIRSRDTNLYAGLAFDAKSFQDRIDTTSSVADKRAKVLTASLYGDHRDNAGWGALNVYSLALSAGDINLQTPAVRALDNLSARSDGRYEKLAFNLARLQNISEAVSFYAAINGQIASKNLDASEKMELGGMYAVRAYPEGEAYADQGYVLTLEGRLLLPRFAAHPSGQLQLIAFADAGSVRTNKNPWTTDSNRRTLSGAGVGLNWTVANDFFIKAYYARKLGNDSATSAPDASGRFWVQAVKYF